MANERKNEFLTPEIHKRISDELLKANEAELKKIMQVGVGFASKDQQAEQNQLVLLRDIHKKEKVSIENRLAFIAKMYQRKKRVQANQAKKLREEYNKFQEHLKGLLQDSAQRSSLYPLKVSLDFYNWSGTIQTKNNSNYFFSVSDDDMVKWFHPVTTRDEVCKIVKQAKQDNKRIRCFGSRHSFTNLFGDDGTVLISMLPVIPARLNFDLPEEQYPDLSISTTDGDLNYLAVDEKSGILTVGGGVTNEMIRKYLVNSNSNWQVPTSVVLVEVTAGGFLSTICHGAGMNYRTISDYVTSVEFVDPNGEVFEIPGALPNGKEILKSAAGALGLFGIVTKVSFKLEPKSIAVFAPAKVPLAKAIPPPDSTSNDDIQAFYKNCEKSYNGFIWFPGANDVWVYCWDTTNQVPPNKKLTPEYPSKQEASEQEWRSFLFDQIRWVNAILGGFSWWRTLRSDLALASMPDYSNNPVYTPKENAMYFARGLRNVKLRDAELEIPLLLEGSQADNRKAWDLARAFWSAAVEYVKNELIIDATLEMRILAGSNVTLAPERGNKYTLSVEIVADAPTDLNRAAWEEEWKRTVKGFHVIMGKVAKENGIPSHLLRPHWAKEHYLSVPEFRARFGDQPFVDFKADLAAVAKSRNLSMADFFSRFSNNYLDDLFLGS